MDWDNSYYTMSESNNYAIWAFLKKLFDEDKIYRGTDVVPWSGRSGTSYSRVCSSTLTSMVSTRGR